MAVTQKKKWPEGKGSLRLRVMTVRGTSAHSGDLLSGDSQTFVLEAQRLQQNTLILFQPEFIITWNQLQEIQMFNSHQLIQLSQSLLVVCATILQIIHSKSNYIEQKNHLNTRYVSVCVRIYLFQTYRNTNYHNVT